MATKASQKTVDNGNERVHLWETLNATDLDGAAVDTPGLPLKSVSVGGNFDSATCTFQGSINGTTWFGLLDPAGNALAFTAAGGGQIGNGLPRYVRPLVSSAGGSTDLDALLYSTK
jgi:hypothetical protein